MSEAQSGHLVPEPLIVGIEKMYASMVVSSQMLNPDPPTDEEREASRERKREAWRLYDAARPALDAITDPLARAILDLHHADEVEFPKCAGCDFGGYEAEEPEWPCRTVQAVAAQHGVELPDAGYLWSRP